MWLEHVSLRSLGRASQLQRTKHNTSADPRRAFCCCRQCFKKPQGHICLFPRGENQNCSCFIFEHAWNKFQGIANTNDAQLMRGDDQYFCLRLCLTAEKGIANNSCSHYISNKMNKGGARVCHKSRGPE